MPPAVRERYDLGELLAADFNGVLVWVVVQASELAYGPFVGAVFADAVLAGWQANDFDRGTVYTNPDWWA